MLCVRLTPSINRFIYFSRIAMKHYSKNPQLFIDRLKAMHVADQLSLQIPGEPAPRLKGTKEKDWSKVSLPFISIGYESKLTPLQLLTFYNAVANNGKMVQPLFVKEIRRLGNPIKQFKAPVMNPKICSEETLSKIKAMLEILITRT